MRVKVYPKEFGKGKFFISLDVFLRTQPLLE